MKRRHIFLFVLLVGALYAQDAWGQSPYGTPPAYGPPMGYAPMHPAMVPNPYGVAPNGQGGYAGMGYMPPSYAPAGYAPQGPPPGYAPAAYVPQGPPPGYAPAGYAPQGPPPGYAPAGYAPQGPPPGYGPAPQYSQGGAYGPAGYPTHPAQAMEVTPPPGPSYGGEMIYTDPGYGSPMIDYCSSCGANCGACDCSAYGLGGCGFAYNPLRQVFGSLELLSWYRNGTALPPLVTTSPQGTVRANAGVLGLPTTRVLVGDERADGEGTTGVRFTIGTWFDPQKEYGLVYRLTAPGSDDFNFSLASNDGGVPTIALPFFDTVLDDQNALLIAFNDPVNGVLATGNVNVSVRSEMVNHDLYTMLMISKGCGWRTDFLFGYQNTTIEESLVIDTFSTSQSALFLPGFAVGTTMEITDVLSVENEFNGGVVGIVSEVQHGPWSLRFLGKVAVGGTNTTATVAGSTVFTEPTTPPTVSTREGGLLAQPTNIGTFEAESTTIAPEGTLTLGYCCSQNLRLTAGYSFMYWTHIVPVNAIIDTTVNPSQIGGGVLAGDPRPAPVIAGDTDFWMMGFNIGAEYRY